MTKLAKLATLTSNPFCPQFLQSREIGRRKRATLTTYFIVVGESILRMTIEHRNFRLKRKSSQLTFGFSPRISFSISPWLKNSLATSCATRSCMGYGLQQAARSQPVIIMSLSHMWKSVWVYGLQQATRFQPVIIMSLYLFCNLFVVTIHYDIHTIRHYKFKKQIIMLPNVRDKMN